MEVNIYADASERLRDVLRVRVGDLAQEELGADADDLGSQGDTSSGSVSALKKYSAPDHAVATMTAANHNQ